MQLNSPAPKHIVAMLKRAEALPNEEMFPSLAINSQIWNGRLNELGDNGPQ